MNDILTIKLSFINLILITTIVIYSFYYKNKINFYNILIDYFYRLLLIGFVIYCIIFAIYFTNIMINLTYFIYLILMNLEILIYKFLNRDLMFLYICMENNIGILEPLDSIGNEVDVTTNIIYYGPKGVVNYTPKQQLKPTVAHFYHQLAELRPENAYEVLPTEKEKTTRENRAVLRNQFLDCSKNWCKDSKWHQYVELLKQVELRHLRTRNWNETLQSWIAHHAIEEAKAKGLIDKNLLYTAVDSKESKGVDGAIIVKDQCGGFTDLITLQNKTQKVESNPHTRDDILEVKKRYLDREKANILYLGYFNKNNYFQICQELYNNKIITKDGFKIVTADMRYYNQPVQDIHFQEVMRAYDLQQENSESLKAGEMYCRKNNIKNPINVELIEEIEKRETLKKIFYIRNE